MAQSRLIELSYFDPHTSIRLTTYADTIVTDYSSPNRIISAVRFGGYPEVVKAMSDAIYGGATIDVPSAPRPDAQGREAISKTGRL